VKEELRAKEEGEAQEDEGGSADVNMMPGGAMLTSDIIRYNKKHKT
jgi:hypothetical protein